MMINVNSYNNDSCDDDDDYVDDINDDEDVLSTFEGNDYNNYPIIPLLLNAPIKITL